MGIEIVAFISANAFSMNIQMNVRVKKGIKRMTCAESIEASGMVGWKFPAIFN
jgi:hypothetical protein